MASSDYRPRRQRRLIGIQSAAASGLGQPHQQRDGDSGQGATAALDDDAEQQKDAAAHEVEGEDPAQRAGLADQPVQP
ncbi:MAG: hypothetical protein WBM40_21715 [Thiohalocapsa sp.]